MNKYIQICNTEPVISYHVRYSNYYVNMIANRKSSPLLSQHDRYEAINYK